MFAERDREASAAQILKSVPDRELDRLNRLYRQADGIGDELQRMIDRYHGNPPRDEACEPATPPDGHLGVLNRLSDRLDRIEKLVSELNLIG
jgi:hypothetical protein